MKSIKVLVEKLICLVFKIWPICWIILGFSGYMIYRQFYCWYDSVFAIVSAISVLLLFILFSFHSKLIRNNIPTEGYIATVIIAIYSGYRMVSLLKLNEVMPGKPRLISFACDCYFSFWLVLSILSLIYKYLCQGKNTKYSKTRILESLVIGFVLCFVVFYYVPAQIFFASFQDYHYSYWILARAFIGILIFYTVLICFLNASFKDSIYKKAISIETGLLVAIYIQYMFMNKSINMLDGTSYRVSEHIIEIIINIVVWVLAILVPILIKTYKIYPKICAAMGALHIFSYVLLLITADKVCFQNQSVYFNYEEQFVVGNNNNVIVIIIDAADNKYISELIENNNSILEEYKDFTVYNNTCSVYDFTNLSQLQMVTNFPFDNTITNSDRRKIAWNTPWVNEFYNRFHDNDYTINFFNFDYENSEYIIDKFDNAVKIDSKKQGIRYINYKMIRAKNQELIAYTLLPNIFKQNVSLKNISNPEPVVIYSLTSGYYDNEDFYDNASKTSISDKSNYLIFQHIKGVHSPNDNIETMEYCLEATDKYIDRLKELGVYDRATVIITADHGILEDNVTSLEAATPMFFMKKPYEEHDKYIITNSPETHADIMATLLYCAGLYKESEISDSDIVTSSQVTQGLGNYESLLEYCEDNPSDVILFGKPIGSYEENEIIERQWFDRHFDPSYTNTGKYNVYCGFTYEGNTSLLEEYVNNRVMKEYQLTTQNE